MRSIFNIVFLLAAFWATSQGFPGGGALNSAIQQGGGTNAAPRPVQPKVKVPIDWHPNYIKFSYDAIPLGRSIARPGQNSQDVQVHFNVDKFFLALEVGTQDFLREKSYLLRNPQGTADSIRWSYRYTNKGTFFRFGPDINLIKNNKNGGALTFGVRYGRASFEDRMVYSGNTGLGENTYEDHNDKIVSQWMEFVTGLNVEVWKNLHMGFMVRYKIQRGDQQIGTMKPYDIPGFGRYANFNTVGFNYYFGWAIRLREKPTIPATN